MARVTDDLPGSGSQGAEGKIAHLQAGQGDGLKVPSADFITDADIARDGQDLVLTTPDGRTIVIDGYFAADPAPVITAPGGTALTPQLVESFVHGAGPVQMAAAGTMGDVTPVGAVHEVHGHATVTHPDGTTENVVQGTAIYQGDVIETEGDGAVEIAFIDESSFAVSANARLAIDEFVFDPSSQGGESNFSMLRGMFVYTSGLIGREDPDDVKIGTPVGSIGIRGTTIAGNVDTGEITVVEGAIVLRANDGTEVTLASQFGTAQFLPNGNVVQMPNVTAADLGQKFASMNSVAPAFFATIDNAAPDQGGDNSGDTPPAQQQGGDSNAGATSSTGASAPAPADAPADGTTDGTADQSSLTDPGADMTMTTDAVSGDSFGGSTDTFGGTTDSFSGSTADSTGTESLLSSTAFSADTTASSTTTTTATLSSSGTTTTSTTTTAAGPATVPLGLVISQTVIDDDLDVLPADAVATITTTASFPSVAFTLVSAKLNGVDVTGTGMFTISGTGASAQILLTNQTDVLASTDVLQFVVRGTLPDGRIDTQTFNVTVDDLTAISNITAVDSTADSTLTVDENATGAVADLTAVITLDEAPASQAVTWTLVSAVSANSTDVSGNISISPFGSPNQGQIQLTGGLDFEAVGGSMNIVVQAQTVDDTGQVVTFTKTLAVTINNLDDETPVLNVDNLRTVNEGSSVIITTAFLSASDVDTANASLTFTVVNGPNYGQLELTTGPGVAITSFTQADLIAGRVKYAHDGSETASDSFMFDIDDGAGHVVTSNVFSLTVNPVNDAPTLGADTFLIAENSIGGTSVGGISTATDPEGDTLTYSETGNGTGAGLFQIDAAGSITVQAGAYLDFEGTNSYTYEVRVDDGNGGFATTMMTINISDIPDETITGNAGNNTLLGGAGDDIFVVNDADGNDTISGGGQTSVDVYDATAVTGNMTVTLTGAGAGTAVNGVNTDTFTGIEQILTGNGSDTFAVNNANASLDLNAGGGADLIDFSALGAGNAVTIDIGSGAVSINSGSAGSAANFENVKGSLGDDTITGSAANNVLWGMGGNDTFIAADADGNDTIDGGAGIDTYDAHGVTSNLMFDMLAGTISDGTNTDTFTNIEHFVSSSGTSTFMAYNGDGAQTFDNSFGNTTTSGSNYDAQNVTSNIVFDMGTGGAGAVFDGVNTDTVIDVHQFRGGTGTNTYVAHDDDGSQWFTMDAGGTHIYNASAVTYGIIFDASANSITANTDVDLVDAGVIDSIIGGSGNDIFAITTVVSGLSISGGAGTDTIRFDAPGSYNAADFTVASGVEVLDGLMATVSINLDVTAGLFANGSGNLTINLDGGDALNLNFGAFGGGGSFNLVSGNLSDAGAAVFHNTVTGNNLYINYAPSTTTITQTGAGGAGVLYLNTMTGADGFAIRDNIAEGYGRSLAGLGDIDGDGFDDIGMTKSLGAPDNGKVFILDGQAGGYTDINVGTFPGAIDSGLFNIGTSSQTDEMTIARVGDFNGDGIADYIVGAPMSDTQTGPTSTSGNAQVIDGATGSVIVELDGVNVMDLAGMSVSGIGDINNDGYADVIIGAPGADANGTESGSAFVLFGGAYAPNTVIDVTTMGGPFFAGDLVAGAFNADAKGVEIFEGGPMGTVAFVMKTNGQIDVVNISDPSAPFIHGVSPLGDSVSGGTTNITTLAGYNGTTDAMNGLVDIKVADNFLYILSGAANSASQGQITVLNISDPVNPVFVDSMHSSALFNARAIDVDLASGKLVVTAGGGAANSFFVINALSDGHIASATVGDTTMVGSLASSAQLAASSEIVMNGSYAYVVTAYDPDGAGSALPGTLQVVNFSAPATPVLGTQINIADIKNIFFDKTDNKLYVISSTGGTGQVSVYSTATPGSPALLGSSTNNAFLAGATDIVVDHGVAYVTTPGGVEAVNISNPASISMIGLLPGGAPLNDGNAVAIDSDGFLHVVTAPPSATNGSLASVDLLPAGLQIDGLAANDFLGKGVSGAGDFNNDGFADFMVSYKNGGTGEVAIFYGGPGVESGVSMANAVKFTGIALDSDNEVPVGSMGDINGDGISDIAMFAAGANSGDGQLYVMFGGGYTAGSTQSASASASLTISAPGVSMEGGGATGDFNGDGFDDMAVVMRSGTQADIYVIYGNAALGGTHDMTWLNNAANAFHMAYTIPAGADPNNFDFTVSAAGDIDGDGFYDLLIGLPDVDNNIMSNTDGFGTNEDDADGSALVVYGRGVGGAGTVVYDNGVNDADPAAAYVEASANNQRIVGSDAVDVLSNGAGFTGTVFRAGAGDDFINLNGTTSFADIDGGGGWDTLAFFSGTSINLTGIGAGEISRIERIDLQGTSQLLQLTMRNIFDLMHGSDDGTFSITSSSITNTLQIDNMGSGAQGSANEVQIANILHADGVTDGGAFWAFAFGGNELQIDKNLVSNGDVNIV